MDKIKVQKESIVKRAFSLVELSIVLIIIGLLVSGVSVGSTLIKQTKLRKQIDQLQIYKTAVNAFELNYAQLPGDFDQVTSFFSGTASSNGNNNGIIEGVDGSTMLEDKTTDGEKVEFFRHLSLAGLLDGDYDGTLVRGSGVPILEYDDSSGMVACGYNRENNFGSAPHHGGFINNDIGGINLYLALTYNASSNVSLGASGHTLKGSNGVFIPQDIQKIDLKMDDGLPDSGIVFGFGVDCTDSAYTAYDVSQNTPKCYGFFMIRNL